MPSAPCYPPCYPPYQSQTPAEDQLGVVADLARNVSQAWFAQFGPMPGWCGEMGEHMLAYLYLFGYDAGTVVSGFYLSTPDPELGLRVDHHVWVEYDTLILDPTVRQFGADLPFVTQHDDPAYQRRPPGPS